MKICFAARNIDWPTFKSMWDDVAVRWFKTTNVIDPGLTHPQFVWDATPHSGASQAHTHVSTFMGRGCYMGNMEALAVAANSYQNAYGR